MTKLLLVDDDPDALMILSRLIKKHIDSISIEVAASFDSAVKTVEKFKPDLAILDLCLNQRLGVESGFELLKEIVQSYPRTKIIVLTGNSNIENGVRALNMGASHFLEKPPEIEHLLALIKDCARQSELFRAFEAKTSGSKSSLLDFELCGDSEATRNLRADIMFAASNSQAILLLGETGTGKSLSASLIHQLSARKSRAFVCHSPKYLGSDLINSELFGHTKGAFTGATETRLGLLCEADGGTFFLDEVDELPPETQISLLRVIEHRRFRAIGSNKEQASDFRLISASNRAFEDLKKLRDDFYHRIAHKIIRIPALRDRKSDISILCDSILLALYKREGVRVISLSPQACAKLQDYDWPGNIRELQSLVEGAAYRAQFHGRAIILDGDIEIESTRMPAACYEGGGYHCLVENYKKLIVNEVLVKYGNNQAKAAKMLGMDRSSFRRILGLE